MLHLQDLPLVVRMKFVLVCQTPGGALNLVHLAMEFHIDMEGKPAREWRVYALSRATSLASSIGGLGKRASHRGALAIMRCFIS